MVGSLRWLELLRHEAVENVRLHRRVSLTSTKVKAKEEDKAVQKEQDRLTEAAASWKIVHLYSLDGFAAIQFKVDVSKSTERQRKKCWSNAAAAVSWLG